MDNISKGKKGEDICCKYLAEQGCEIIARNFRSPYGEIDVIAKCGDTIMFVEVKARTGNKFGSPAMAVDRKKQKKIIETAYFFITEGGISNMNYSFDVCEVFLKNAAVNYISHAFDASAR